MESVGSLELGLLGDYGHWSASALKILSVEDEGIKPNIENFFSLIHPDDRDEAKSILVGLLPARKNPVECEFRVTAATGVDKLIKCIAEAKKDKDGKTTAISMIIGDHNEQVGWRNDVNVLTKVIDHAQEGVMITDMENIIRYVNPSFCRITGYEAEEVIGKGPSFLKSGRQSPRFYKALWTAINTADGWQGEIWNKRKNGDIYPQDLTITALKDENGNVMNYTAIFHDISELRKSNEIVKFQTYHDSLTGLPNRQLFTDRLKHTLTRASRSNDMLAVMCLDLDNFKRINESLGHKAGDLILKSVAIRLVGVLREVDTVSRPGSDEFLILLENVRTELDAVSVATKIIDSISDPFTYKGENLVVTPSLGMTMYPSDGSNAEVLLKNAHIAVSKSKEMGGASYQKFKPLMHKNASKKMSMENKMRKGLDRDEFIIYYQPKVDVKTGRINGVEALSRWKTDDGKLVSPMDYIPLAEQTGLIVPLGEKVLTDALDRASKWAIAGHENVTISVNLSARQFQSKDLMKFIWSTLEATGLDPTRLCLELTESAIIRDLGTAFLILGELKKIGVKVSMDDFGTGYSSLSYLKNLPIDEVKIDQSFVKQIPFSSTDSAITKTIVDMAHALNLSVTAEGVERKSQVYFLESCGCDSMQGFFYSPPVPEEQLDSMLENGFEDQRVDC